MFINGLGQVIRAHFGLKVTKHECWTFEHVANYEICGNPGNCVIHDAPWVEHQDSSCISPCYEYRNKIYLGVGEVTIRGGQRYMLRTRIEHTYWDLSGELYIASVWASKPDGELLRGQFGLFEDGTAYVSDQECPLRPPSKIDFWRESVPAD